MMSEPLFQLWHIDTKTCRITQATPFALYWVAVHDGPELVAQGMFNDHDDAINFAVEEMRRPPRYRQAIM
jgi:hypothetical protein